MMCGKRPIRSACCCRSCNQPMKPVRGSRSGTAQNWNETTKEAHVAQNCSHLNTIKIESTDKHVCEDCVKTGDTWVHLRLCLECGHVGCCDSSKNKHATKHFRATKHPLIRSN